MVEVEETVNSIRWITMSCTARAMDVDLTLGPIDVDLTLDPIDVDLTLGRPILTPGRRIPDIVISGWMIALLSHCEANLLQIGV